MCIEGKAHRGKIEKKGSDRKRRETQTKVDGVWRPSDVDKGEARWLKGWFKSRRAFYLRGNATANTPVTGQRPSHKMDFMTPIDTTRSLSPSLRRHCPISLPLSPFQWTTADAYVCLYPSRDHSSRVHSSFHPNSRVNRNIIRRVYSSRKKFSIPSLLSRHASSSPSFFHRSSTRY